MSPIPITILTGFLGSGKTTVILSLIPQLPQGYQLALLKNEFGDVAIDSQLAASSSIASIRELLNGCICCNLVGQMGEALDELRRERQPDRIVIETSGSAFPATLAMEVNRLAREERSVDGEPKYLLDGVVVVIDVENWKGYADTSYTAQMQAKFTDLMVLNKWETAGERKLEECLDRIGDLESQVAVIHSDMGKVDWQVLLGLDSALARKLGKLREHDQKDSEYGLQAHRNTNDHAHDHQSEVEVLSVTLVSKAKQAVLDMASLQKLLTTAPRDEVYRIKAFLYTTESPASSDSDPTPSEAKFAQRRKYILNWAFGRWTFTAVSLDDGVASTQNHNEPIVGMTIVLARGEADKWAKKLHAGVFFQLENDAEKGEAVTRGVEKDQELYIGRTL